MYRCTKFKIQLFSISELDWFLPTSTSTKFRYHLLRSLMVKKYFIWQLIYFLAITELPCKTDGFAGNYDYDQTTPCNDEGMVFCYQNCSDLLWEKILLVIEKFFWKGKCIKRPISTFGCRFFNFQPFLMKLSANASFFEAVWMRPSNLS